MKWFHQGENYGIVRAYLESADQPTRVEYAIYSVGRDRDPDEFMISYTDRERAVKKLELLERFRETAREALTAS